MTNSPTDNLTNQPTSQASMMTSILVADIGANESAASHTVALMTLAEYVVSSALRWAPGAGVHEISIYPGPASPDGYDICITLSGLDEATRDRLLGLASGLASELYGGDASVTEWVPGDPDDVRFPVWAARQDDAHTDADVDDDDEEAGNGQE